MTLADIGSNTRVLIDALATLPGPAKERASRYLRQRMEGRPARLTGILQEAFGSKSRFYDDFAALKSARGKSANVLYGQANKVNNANEPNKALNAIRCNSANKANEATQLSVP